VVESAEPKEDTMSRIITESENLHSPRWEMGTVIQEIHTGECCAEPHCDFYQPLWEMGFQVGWCRAGKQFDPDDDEPRLPVRVLYDPSEVS
jgi:hypothetical protein